MVDGQVKFLNLVGFCRRNPDAYVSQLSQPVGLLARQPDDLQPFRLSNHGRIKYVAAITRGRDSQEDVVWLSVAIHLLGEDKLDRLLAAGEGRVSLYECLNMFVDIVLHRSECLDVIRVVYLPSVSPSVAEVEGHDEAVQFGQSLFHLFLSRWLHDEHDEAAAAGS